ncbi:NUDIX hydrolase [Kitasatospora sp. GP82]|uniref:NUDIX hydrolase n=1 Tax=Kitasatospora sp. GP82 TaxID=3035089 RepID=UPI0024750745|nr:NUDIX hydrolase [Kitasatospora sp. GP82]MDH6124967.1 8-oxo-dGTP pyrophosphatase MutT (NUDIX family) [Kitasatospora sp. GP82]
MSGSDGRGRGLLAAAGVLIPDERGRILVVRLPYDARHPIAIPGGGWEPSDGSPRQTAFREIGEELGITPELGPLACIDWSLDDFRPPIAAHLYWAASLPSGQLAALRPQVEEVGGWAFLTDRQISSALPPKLSRRVTACLTAPRGAGPLELEDSHPVGHTIAHVPPVPPPPYTGAAGLDLAGSGALVERQPPLGREAYIAGLPRIRAKARMLFTDTAGRVLLVRLRPQEERPYWTLPGGSVEADRELPRAAARRETREELGWELEPGRLLALDWSPDTGGSATLVYVFDGGEVAAELLGRIRLPQDELVEWRMFTPAAARGVLSEQARSRLDACLAVRAAGSGGPAELVRGRPV